MDMDEKDNRKRNKFSFGITQFNQILQLNLTFRSITKRLQHNKLNYYPFQRFSEISNMA